MVGLRGRKLCGGGCEGKLLCVKLSEALSRIINFATISGWTDRRQKLVSSRRRCPSGAACRVLGCDSSETDQLRRRRRRRRLGGRSVALDDDAAAPPPPPPSRKSSMQWIISYPVNPEKRRRRATHKLTCSLRLQSISVTNSSIIGYLFPI